MNWKIGHIGEVHPPEVVQAIEVLMEYSLKRDGVLVLFPLGGEGPGMHGFAVFGAHPDRRIADTVQKRLMRFISDGVAKAESLAADPYN